MRTYQVNILNPKADRLLKDLADLNLISIEEAAKDKFRDAISKLRKKAAANPPSLDEITKEVETVRANR